MKLKEKLPASELFALLLITLWIALWNGIALAFHEPLSKIYFTSWPFMISACFFFFFEEGSYKKRFLDVLVGGEVGLILAWFLIVGANFLGGLGLSYVTSVMIPLVIVLLILIIGKPINSMLFNSPGFAYFVIATIQADIVIEKTPSYMLSLALGCLILCLGCVGCIKLVTAYYVNKAKKAAK